jgi:hypothetical protein
MAMLKGENFVILDIEELKIIYHTIKIRKNMIEESHISRNDYEYRIVSRLYDELKEFLYLK